ncbi:MFS transporter [Psychromarinibacter halotolerans]|uniref:MFS transporter n=1 Tax=Psychromarinibacter halotolerans TaxID=1775175 RepID=A0ABV7GZ24_9RHOB|nr:MFS transporter [Psychromarinibacter halotolerans]MDF0596269.1 MFS transporter [Psychromarinibacter halotolerans]
MADPRPATPTDLPLIIVAIATCLALVVFTAPLTTLDAMTDALGLSPGAQAWIMSGMPLGAACGLLTAGALGDTLGRRRTFVAGLWLTAASSVAAALSVNGLMLIVMRVVQGLGSAGIMACGLGLLGQVYDGQARRRAAAVWAAALGAGVAVGPLIASGLLAVSGWTATHWAVAAVSAALAVMAMSRLPESDRTGDRVDIGGSVLLIAGLACLMSALIEVRVGSTGLVTALLIGAVVLLGLFWRIERRTGNPILALELFRYPDFSGATLAAFASGAGVLALMSMVPTALVRGMGQSPMSAAVILLAWSGVTVVAALASGRLPERLTPRQRVIGAIAGCGVGQALMLAAGTGTSWAVVLPGLLIAGVSNGILNASLGHEAVQTVPPERAAMGSAANNTARYLGSALGIALISVLIAQKSGAGTDFFDAWHAAVIASTAFSVLGVLAMLVVSRPRGVVR